MKQCVTQEQLLGLDRKQLVKLYTWIEEKSYQKELLTIGRMIEFLGEKEEKAPCFLMSTGNGVLRHLFFPESRCMNLPHEKTIRREILGAEITPTV